MERAENNKPASKRMNEELVEEQKNKRSNAYPTDRMANRMIDRINKFRILLVM